MEYMVDFPVDATVHRRVEGPVEFSETGTARRNNPSSEQNRSATFLLAELWSQPPQRRRRVRDPAIFRTSRCRPPAAIATTIPPL